MRDLTELLVGVMVVALVSFSIWMGSKQRFVSDKTAAAALQEPKAELTKERSDFRKTRDHARSAVHAGFGGTLPPRTK